jgi:tetratricopeptide (TPR) repeat protein
MFYGDIDGAEAPAFKALSLNPNLAEVQHTLGKFLFARGRPNMGEPLARAVELNPNLPDVLATYAHWHWWNREQEGVAELYRRALELDPLNVGRYGALGHFLAVSDDYDGARKVIEQLETLFDSAASYRAIAKVYDLIGDVDHAIAWAIRARDAEPHNPEHVNQLAAYFVDIGEFAIAKELMPELGVGLLFKMRRYDELIDVAGDLMLDYPDDMRLRVLVAAAYNFTGNHDQAVRLIKSTGILDTISNGVRGSDDFLAFMILEDATYGSGRIDEARDLVAWSLELFVHGDDAYWWVSLLNACENAILGEDAEVYRRLQKALEGTQLVWDPLLKDTACLKRLHDDPAYLAVVKHFEDRRAILRARLPITLAQYGVSL